MRIVVPAVPVFCSIYPWSCTKHETTEVMTLHI